MPIYSPGNEPDRIKDRIKTLFERVDSAHPDKIIVGLHSNHKKMGETVSEIYKALGYESGKDFLEAYAKSSIVGITLEAIFTENIVAKKLPSTLRQNETIVLEENK